MTGLHGRDDGPSKSDLNDASDPDGPLEDDTIVIELGDDLAVVLADEAVAEHIDHTTSTDVAGTEGSIDVNDESGATDEDRPDRDTSTTLNIANEPWARQFEEFVTDESVPLERFVSAVVRRRQLAQGAWGPEDIVQQTLIKTALWWTRVKDENRRGWTRTVALNEVRHAQRAEIRQRLHGAKAPRGFSTAATLYPVERTVMARLAAEDAQSAIADLGGRQAAVAYLRDVDGFSTAEIAEMLALSPNTVATYLKRRAHPLRVRLEQWTDTKVLAFAAICGVGGALAVWVLDRFGVRPPDLLTASEVLTAALSAALAMLAAALRQLLIEAAQIARRKLVRRTEAAGRRRAQNDAAAGTRRQAWSRRRPRRRR